MELFLLGPVCASRAHQPVNLGVPKQRLVLAVLALAANRPVATERMVDLLWPQCPPTSARGMIHTYVSRLRPILGAGPDGIRLERDPAGYLLRCDPACVDVHRFRALLAEACRAGDDRHRTSLLDRALGLWRGTPLAGIATEEVRARLCRDLEEAHLTAVEDRIEARLRLDRPEPALDELLALTGEHPLRPRLTAALMRELHRAGRTAEALHTYHELRRRLSDELGLDPPASLQALHRTILRDPALDPPPTGSGIRVPRQLPGDLASFTGRRAELDRLLTLDTTADPAVPPTAVTVLAIDGMAGVGKTALAVHAAHRLAHRYPDGQLFIDIHGYTQGLAPVDPADALDRMLRALGVAGEQIPAELDDRAALYRTRLAGRRVLVLLDNAATDAQVQPLLPGTPDCLVLVTSRCRLSGLDPGRTVALDVLPQPDAVALLTRALGTDRLRGQPPELLSETVELCGRLPLAIRIAAARLGSHPTWSLAHLVERLRNQRQRLWELAAGPRSVAAALALSYRRLTAEQQYAYRRLGLHPGPDLEPYAAAALTGRTVARASRLLDGLLDAHLLHEPIPGRYVLHDLVRAHAARTATRAEPEPDRRAALSRLLDYYRHAASAAMDTAYPYERGHRPRVAPASTPVPRHASPRQAVDWLDAELPNLLAAARHAAGSGGTDLICQLSTILHRHLRTRGCYRDAETLHQQALTAARATGRLAGQVDALLGLGDIRFRHGRYQQAMEHFRQARALAGTTGGRPGEPSALAGLGWVQVQLGRPDQAIDQFGQALQLARTTGDRSSELAALTGLGELHRLQSRYDQAADHFGQALQLARATGNRPSEAQALLGLGGILRTQGRYQQAADQLWRALRLARATGNRPAELETLTGLGHILRMQGRYRQAADRYGQVLEIARATGHRAGELYARYGLAEVCRLQRQHEPAADRYQQVLTIASEIGNRNWQFEARQGLGRLGHATGHPDQAISHHRRALELATELGQPADQARAHDGLAHAYRALDQPEPARHHWQRALEILTALATDRTDDDHTTATTIRAHLTALDRSGLDPRRPGPLSSGGALPGLG